MPPLPRIAHPASAASPAVPVRSPGASAASPAVPVRSPGASAVSVDASRTGDDSASRCSRAFAAALHSRVCRPAREVRPSSDRCSVSAAVRVSGTLTESIPTSLKPSPVPLSRPLVPLLDDTTTVPWSSSEVPAGSAPGMFGSSHGASSRRLIAWRPATAAGPSSKSLRTKSTSAESASFASLPSARKWMVDCGPALSLITRAVLRARTHSPSSPARTSMFASNPAASWASFTAGRACSPVGLVTTTRASDLISLPRPPRTPRAERCPWTLPSPPSPPLRRTAALQIVTRPRRRSSSISIAISAFISAPPRSTSTATPRSDHAVSIAAEIAATSVPRPPSGLPPHAASGTLSPTIWRTMSPAPRATWGE